MTWEDSLSFVLDEKMGIRRLACTDRLKAPDGFKEDMDAEEHFDVEFALATGTYAGMLSALIDALGGEVSHDR
jgi:recombination associated protein RdgC